MSNALVIVTDLGLLRAYRVTQKRADRPAHLELIEEYKPMIAHQKRSDQVSDQAGRFPRGGGTAGVHGDLSAGESLSTEAEQNRRNIHDLAERIDALLENPEVTHCSIAISGAIHNQLLDAISPAAREKIGQALAANLAKMAPNELQAHFSLEIN